MLNSADLILPDWPAPAQVRALQTTRHGGVSSGPYRSLNLGEHVGDDPLHVARNRQQLEHFLPSEPVWLRQVHGIEVIDAGMTSCLPQADAAIAQVTGAVCAVMTADCLPVLLCDRAGTTVAAAHAGWRGLNAGVIEATVKAMPVPRQNLLAWLGPAIGPKAFEVGHEVRDAFLSQDAEAELAFKAHGDQWMADIYVLARQRLQKLGVIQVYGGDWCTYTEADRFFSYRRDGVTGRMASLIWLERSH